jgi:hypothetical protein
LFVAALRASVTKEDIIAVGYRKKQLQVFEALLADDPYFDALKSKKNCTDEGLWQQFFEKNPWIFGYGLNYLYLSTLTDKKLEQVVQGFSVAGRGKRVDALLRSKGAISSLCFVEIKTHRTNLLGGAAYRASCWPPHAELAGAVSQVQGTVVAATDTIREKLDIQDEDGFPTGEQAFNYAPKSYLVIGNLREFIGPNGVNQDQLRSFELFRRNTTSPEIITFDELFERARFIVRASER